MDDVAKQLGLDRGAAAARGFRGKPQGARDEGHDSPGQALRTRAALHGSNLRHLYGGRPSNDAVAQPLQRNIHASSGVWGTHIAQTAAVAFNPAAGEHRPCL